MSETAHSGTAYDFVIPDDARPVEAGFGEDSLDYDGGPATGEIPAIVEDGNGALPPVGYDDTPTAPLADTFITDGSEDSVLAITPDKYAFMHAPALADAADVNQIGPNPDVPVSLYSQARTYEDALRLNQPLTEAAHSAAERAARVAELTMLIGNSTVDMEQLVDLELANRLTIISPDIFSDTVGARQEFDSMGLREKLAGGVGSEALQLFELREQAEIAKALGWAAESEETDLAIEAGMMNEVVAAQLVRNVQEQEQPETAPASFFTVTDVVRSIHRAAEQPSYSRPAQLAA